MQDYIIICIRVIFAIVENTVKNCNNFYRHHTITVHIIKEISREETRRRIIDNQNFDFGEFLPDERLQQSSQDTEVYKHLNQALKELDFEDRKLLIWRYYQQMEMKLLQKRCEKEGRVRLVSCERFSKISIYQVMSVNALKCTTDLPHT
ncbi:hypothetical protein DSM106972_011930 [Dulcicalothrix desertica PCC 7102]|uniref:Uncharacterized protein n=1 Tax=Dulcicalothrix desertica PCC 7102 TaxID=232991 RepID=A0A3S1J7I1_9CYAN|nr:hypothetical protein [Dulcicalothrix desertica]RUT09140.1 hypothetical protein DSM106972_011930 [Dulcicalothrix desertica PCC 7102]TWH55108.1 hypothetical protein CAL7102_03211 [Dulcicalothrix desertica PCC 7102]